MTYGRLVLCCLHSRVPQPARHVNMPCRSAVQCTHNAPLSGCRSRLWLVRSARLLYGKANDLLLNSWSFSSICDSATCYGVHYLQLHNDLRSFRGPTIVLLHAWRNNITIFCTIGDFWWINVFKAVGRLTGWLCMFSQMAIGLAICKPCHTAKLWGRRMGGITACSVYFFKHLDRFQWILSRKRRGFVPCTSVTFILINYAQQSSDTWRTRIAQFSLLQSTNNVSVLYIYGRNHKHQTLLISTNKFIVIHMCSEQNAIRSCCVPKIFFFKVMQRFKDINKSTQRAQSPPRPKSDPGFESGLPD